MKKFAILSTALLIGCGGSGDGTESPYVEGFNPSAAPAGFTRFVTPPIEDLQPGEEDMWCQWLTGPSDAEMDVVKVGGEQSVGGHHVVLYATTALAPVGTSRKCTDEDITSLRYLGAIGGEGVSDDVAPLPPNVVYRIPKGMAIMANVHYVNYTSKPIDCQSVVDVKRTAPDYSKKISTIWTNVDNEITLPPNQKSTMDVHCVMQADYQFFRFGNHMHSIGTSTYSEVIHADMTTTLIREDPVWDAEARFNPNFNDWSIDNAFVVKKGETIHTHCEWENTSPDSVIFPREMCVGFGFAAGDGIQVNCIKGDWTY